MLAREQELINKGDGRKSELTADNYEFTEAGRDGDGARVVQIKPRRQDAMLVEGRAVLNDGGDLLRVEGKLSKNPSFWTSLVNIVRRYARIGGVRVPVATETTAKVKFVGTAQLEVLYDYQSVNGQPVALSEQRSAVPGVSLGDKVRQPARRERAHVDRQRLLEQPPLLRRIGDRRRQRDVREHRLPVRQLHRLVEVRLRGRCGDPPSSGGNPSNAISAS